MDDEHSGVRDTDRRAQCGALAAVAVVGDDAKRDVVPKAGRGACEDRRGAVARSVVHDDDFLGDSRQSVARPHPERIRWSRPR